jgi:lipopolysaccharide/colanic/teichoic acid biosynthesis glycosyltransferase
MIPTDFNPSDRLTIGLATAVGLALTSIAQVVGLLAQIGVTSSLEKLVVVLAIAVVIVLDRLVSRRRRLLKLVDPHPQQLCNLQLDALGAPISPLAEPWAIDGHAPYVARDGDTKLTEQLQARQFVILLGQSGSGTTRTALEQARRLFEPLTTLAPLKATPDATDGSAHTPLVELLDLTLRLPWRVRPYLLWIDDLGHFMEHEVLPASLLRRWLEVNPERKIVATLKSGDQERLLEAAEPLKGRVEEVMKMTIPHRMRVEWSSEEQQRARKKYPGIKDDAAERLAHHFSSGARVVRRYENASESSPAGAAVIQPAIDWYRAGLTRPIPETLLRELSTYYLEQVPLESDPDSLFQQGLGWTTTPVDRSDTGLLRRLPGNEAMFTVPPVLIEHAKSSSASPPTSFWEHLRQTPTTTPELLAIAETAYAMGESEIAQACADRVLQGEFVKPDIRTRAIAVWQKTIGDDDDAAISESADPLGIVERASHLPRTPFSPENVRETAAARAITDGRPGILTRLDRAPMAKASTRVLSLMIFDILGLWLAMICAYLMLDGISWRLAQRATDARIPFVALLVVVLFVGNGLYRRHRLRADFARLLAVLAQAAVLFLVLRLIVGGKVGSLGLIVVGIILAAAFVGPARELHLFVARLLERAALGHKPHVALIGDAAHVKRVATVLTASNLTRRVGQHDIVGWIALGPDDGNHDGPPSLPRLETLTSLSNFRRASIRLSKLVKDHDINELVLCDAGLSEDSATALADIAWLCGAKLRAVTRSRNFLAARNRYVPGEQLPLDELRVPIFDGTQWMMKRCLDIILGSILLLFASPIILVCAVMIRVSSNESVLQPSPQPGRDGKEYRQFKLRATHESKRSGEIGPVTPLGKHLKRYGLDELPQLLNVLRGEMSLVGPRPIGTRALLHMQGWQTRRYLVPPGITGLWQISGRRDHDITEVVRLDLYYVQRWSLFGDIEILLKSIPTVLRGRRAVLVMTEEQHDAPDGPRTRSRRPARS